MSSIKLVHFSDSAIWEQIVISFTLHDVYYLNGYLKTFMVHGDGEPFLIYYESEELKGFNVVMKRDISKFSPFNGVITKGTYFDIITPYGYGGFLFEGDTSISALNRFNEKYTELLNQEHIISEFVRYHPLLNNANVMRGISNVIDLGKTISMDLGSTDIIWSNITSKNRNVIRKAQKSGVEIHHGKGQSLLNQFTNIYNSTMLNDNADSYYFFKNEFYNSIAIDLSENYEMFYAVYKEEIISMAIIIYANGRMHYHLSGSDFKYRNLAPSNLLLYEAACWGNMQGFRTFHLGGGIGSREDSLLKFKQAFNRNSNNIFSIGEKIINQEMYDYLVELRKKIDVYYNCNSHFFPLYRA